MFCSKSGRGSPFARDLRVSTITTFMNVVIVTLTCFPSFSGLTKSKMPSLASTGSTVWMYRYGKRPGTWTNIKPIQRMNPPSTSSSSSFSTKRPRNTDNDEDLSDEANEVEPIGRCAHQVVYNPRTQTFYLHGGNAGSSHVTVVDDGSREGLQDSDGVVGEPTQHEISEKRLDDFWSMTLERKVVLLMRVDVLKADTLNLQTLTRRDSEKSTIRDSSATVSLGGE